MNKYGKYILLTINLLFVITTFVTAQNTVPNNTTQSEFVLRQYDREAMERYKKDPTFNTVVSPYSSGNAGSNGNGSGSSNGSGANTRLESDENDAERVSTGESRPWSSSTEPPPQSVDEPAQQSADKKDALPPPKQQKEQKSDPVEIENSNSLDLNLNWVWIILAAIILFFVVAYFMGLKPNSFNKVAAEEEQIGQKHQDINDIKFETELEKAIRLGNYKLAVRILYLESLKTLNDRSMIHWAHNKTNWDYLSELKADEKIKTAFKNLTLTFDYVWYGDFKLTEKDFGVAKSQFDNFKTIF